MFVFCSPCVVLQQSPEGEKLPRVDDVSSAAVARPASTAIFNAHGAVDTVPSQFATLRLQSCVGSSAGRLIDCSMRRSIAFSGAYYFCFFRTQKIHLSRLEGLLCVHVCMYRCVYVCIQECIHVCKAFNSIPLPVVLRYIVGYGYSRV